MRVAVACLLAWLALFSATSQPDQPKAFPYENTTHRSPRELSTASLRVNHTSPTRQIS